VCPRAEVLTGGFCPGVLSENCKYDVDALRRDAWPNITLYLNTGRIPRSQYWHGPIRNTYGIAIHNYYINDFKAPTGIFTNTNGIF